MGRLMLGLVTLGYSEVLYYTPKEFLLECKKASENENATFFDNFMARATQKVLRWKIDVRKLCKEKLDVGKKMLANSPAMQELRDLAKEAQGLRELKVKKFIEACNKADISPQELQELVLSIQCYRWAKTYRKEALQHLREGCRQFPKGMDRTLEEKIIDMAFCTRCGAPIAAAPAPGPAQPSRPAYTQPVQPRPAAAPAPQYRQPQPTCPQQPQQEAAPKKKKSVWFWIGVILLGLVFLAMKLGW